jgi:hypothetical protein
LAIFAEQKTYEKSEADIVNGLGPEPGGMLSDAGLLPRANRLRQFIAAVEDRARHDGERTPEKQQWIEWARAKAHWLNPLVRRSDPILNAPEPVAPSCWQY